MKRLPGFGLLLSLVFATSCQSGSGGSPHSATPAISNEAYNAQIRADKKKQAELDLPFRGFSNDKTLQTIAFTTGPVQAQTSVTWASVEKNRPELMIMSWNPDKNLALRPEYRSLRENVPVMAVCNDESQNGFLKNWPYAKNLIPDNQEGTYHAKIFGAKKSQVQIIVLDRACESEKQWSWLETELKKPTALKILASNAGEKDRILSLLQKNGIKNAILISNDQVLSSIEKNQVKNLGSIFEATAGVRNVSSSPESNFGLIHINWPGREAQIEIRSGQNEKIQSAQISF